MHLSVRRPTFVVSSIARSALSWLLLLFYTGGSYIFYDIARNCNTHLPHAQGLQYMKSMAVLTQNKPEGKP